MTICGAMPRQAYSQPVAAPPSSTVVPQITYRHRVLPNGLTVYSVKDRHSPTVAIQVWYKVGSKDDPAGRSGFAHLFEHMMFKSTKNMPSEMLDRLTEDVGGENNAFTAEDVTVYFEVVPSHYLETLLWAEAERMANLSVIDANFASERAVVQEEYRQGVLAPPYGRLGVLINERSFTTHPYKRDTIGSIGDLQAASLSDVQTFHRTFYRPDNAVLVVVGDFDDSKLDGWVDRYFGRISKPTTEIPRITTTEPPRNGEKRFKETAPNVPLPALVATFLTPPVSHPDAQALRVAEVVLARGESSRLNRALVYDQQIAAEVSARADLRADAGLFTLQVVAASGKALPEVEKALFSEIEKLQQTPPDIDELRKARNLLLSETLEERETNQGRAFALGNAVVLRGDPELVNTDIARLQDVTPEDVQRVTKQYLLPANRVVIEYENGKDSTVAGVSAASASPESQPAPPTDGKTGSRPQEAPPAPARPRDVFFPFPIEKRISSGLRVIVVPRIGSGLITVQLAAKAGAAQDPRDKAGLASFTANLLTRGAGRRSAPQIAEQIEALGGSLSASAGWDATFVTLSILRANTRPGMEIMADVVRRPRFDSEEIERLRAEELDALEINLQSPGTLARYAGTRIAYGDSPYGHPAGGTPESLRRLTREDISGFHGTHFRVNNSILVLGGDLTPEEGFALAETFFSDWKNTSPVVTPATPTAKTDPLTLPKGGRVVVVDKPDSGQAAVMLIRPSITRTDRNYYAALVADAIFGGGFSSRLNQEIRIKRGLSYGAFSSISPRRLPGPFVAFSQTKNESAADVAEVMRAKLAELATAPLFALELTSRKASLTGSYAREMETGAGLTGEVMELALYNQSLRNLSRHLPAIQSITARQVTEFAATHLFARSAHLIIVGDGKQFLPALKKKFPEAEVIPADKLDLNRVDLKKP